MPGIFHQAGCCCGGGEECVCPGTPCEHCPDETPSSYGVRYEVAGEYDTACCEQDGACDYLGWSEHQGHDVFVWLLPGPQMRVKVEDWVAGVLYDETVDIAACCEPQVFPDAGDVTNLRVTPCCYPCDGCNVVQPPAIVTLWDSPDCAMGPPCKSWYPCPEGTYTFWSFSAASWLKFYKYIGDPCHAVVINADCMWQWSRVDEYGEIWYLEVYRLNDPACQWKWGINVHTFNASPLYDRGAWFQSMAGTGITCDPDTGYLVGRESYLPCMICDAPDMWADCSDCVCEMELGG